MVSCLGDFPHFCDVGFRPERESRCTGDCPLSTSWLVENDFIKFGCVDALSEKQVNSRSNRPEEAPSKGTQ